MTQENAFTTKTCKHCQQEKDIEDFYLTKGTKDGRYSRCKKCHYEINKANVHRWILKKYHEDPEFKQKMIEQSIENTKKRLATEEGRQKHNKYCLEYYHRNKEEILKQKAAKKQQQKEEKNNNQD